MHDRQREYSASVFVFRKPALPYSHRIPKAADILDIWNAPLVREGIGIASLELYRATARFIQDGTSPPPKLRRALLRYYRRMRTRSTPFGCFSAVGIGVPAATTSLVVSEPSQLRLVSQLDAGVLEALYDAGVKVNPDVDPVMRTAPSLYWLGTRLMYYRRNDHDGTSDDQELTYCWDMSDQRKYITAFRQPRRCSSVVRLLREDGFTEQEAWTYIEDLYAAGILIPNDGPTIACAAAGGVVSRQGETSIQPVVDAASALAGSRGDRFIEDLENLERSVGSPFDKRERNSVVHVDTFDDARITIGKSAFSMIRDECWEARRLFGKTKPRLDRFTREFTSRFGSALVPLMEALDPELGLMDALQIELAATFDDVARLTAQAKQRLAEAMAARTEFRVAADDLADVPVRPLPAAWTAQIELLADSPTALDAGQFRLLLKGTSGPSGVEMLTRFAHGMPSLEEAIVRHIQDEEASLQFVTTEIIHIPSGRMANVVQRPPCRRYETEIVGKGHEAAEQVPLDDLHVAVRDDRVILYSKALGGPVSPRVTTAHNHQLPSNIPVYRFLGMLAVEDVVFTNWSWGSLSGSSYLPRVVRGRTIVAAAQWNLTIEPGRLRSGEQNIAAYLETLRREWRLPDVVAVGGGDTRLYLSLDEEEDVGELARIAHRAGRTLSLMEVPEHSGCLLRDATGARYSHELIIPFANRAKDARPAERDGATKPKILPDFASLGTRRPEPEWLQYNLYTGPQLADVLLVQTISPLLQDLMKRGALSGWFFIRYGDPAYHLRLRIRPSGGRETEALGAVDRMLLTVAGQVLVRDVTQGGYIREVRRYGGPELISIAECIFEVDSDLALSLTKMRVAGAPSQELSCVIGGAQWIILHSFGCKSLDAKLAFVNRLLAVHRGSVVKTWNGAYTALRVQYEQTIDVLEERSPGADVVTPLSRYAKDMRELGQVFVGRFEGVPPDSIVGSFLHMNYNRASRAYSREEEQRSLHWLRRALIALLMRSQATKTQRTVGPGCT